MGIIINADNFKHITRALILHLIIYVIILGFNYFLIKHPIIYCRKYYGRFSTIGKKNRQKLINVSFYNLGRKELTNFEAEINFNPEIILTGVSFQKPSFPLITCDYDQKKGSFSINIKPFSGDSVFDFSFLYNSERDIIPENIKIEANCKMLEYIKFAEFYIKRQYLFIIFITIIFLFVSFYIFTSNLFKIIPEIYEDFSLNGVDNFLKKRKGEINEKGN